MKIVIDSKIPYIKGYAELLGETVYIPGGEISPADIKDADAMIIRTRTHCNKGLLEGSNVKFVATATIGYDHIDTAYMKEAGISWTNCPGCNAHSVAQYIECCLLQLAAHGCWQKEDSLSPITAPIDVHTLDRSVFKQLTLGIIGVGNVGRAVLAEAKRMNFADILLCDPPRADREGKEGFSSLDEIAQKADIITFHTPLTHSPATPYPTFHMANKRFFEMLKPSAVVINSSRGEVVDTLALKQAISSNKIRAAVIDTWEDEPHIDLQLLQQAFIGTPHIAGYSADGKANGTRMALQAVAEFFGHDTSVFDDIKAPTLPADYSYYPEGNGRLIAPELKFYDPTRDTIALKSSPEQFELLRGNYPLRRESNSLEQ